MSKKNFKKFTNFYVIITIVAINFVFSFIFGLYVRQKLIEKEEANYKTKLATVISEIQNEVEIDFSKIQTLGEIITSQINTPRAFYDFNSLISVILSSDPSINSIFITLSPNSVNLDESLYPLLDSLNRYNVMWKKNSKNIVFIDSLDIRENNFYFETVRNLGDITIFNTENDNSQLNKIIGIPIYDGTHFIGVIGFAVNFNFVKIALLKNNLNDKTFVADEDGILVYDRNKVTTPGEKYSIATGKDFLKYQKNILKNEEFIKKSKNTVLFFKPFFFKSLNINWKIGIFAPSKEIYVNANFYLFLIILLFFVLSIILVIFFNNRLSKISILLNSFKDYIEKLYKGDLHQEIVTFKSFEEIESISNNINRLRKRLLTLLQIHEQIQEQYISLQLDELSQKDELAISINKTVQSIQERTNARKEALEVKEKNDWKNKGLTILHEAARIEENSLEILTDRINEKISIFTDAFLSSFFILFKDEDNKEEFLESVSTFGLNKKRAFNKKILIGEGVVGSVARERKRQYFEKIPLDYHIIVGGLADMRPQSILIQPLEYEGEFYGILEIAFLKKLQKHEIDFFEAASSEIALSIKNITNNIATNKLLEKMKEQTVAIEKAQELLQSKIKEISIKEQQARESESVLKSVIKAINNTLMTIEYTTEGVLLNVNKKYLDKMNFTSDELKGVNVLDLVKSERGELESVIRRVSKGEYFEKVMKRFTKYGETRWLHSTYTPYYDLNGNISKILYFAFDVTETKEYSEKLEKEIRILQKQIKLLREKI